jgi:urease accessory protein
MTDDDHREFLLDLPHAAQLADGDGLPLAGGGWIAVRAAAEAVADIGCENPAAMARIAWHIGNRHAPLQVLDGGRLRILDDHVLIAMIEGLGGRVDRLTAPFHAEGGAYGGSTAQHGGRHHGGGHHHG